ncbi:MAG TPA: response regulator [Anaerolineae bacterium]|nr:response regulator [Anaerolineae bacterium]
MNKVLVIEDQDSIRANVLELLDAEGYSVRGAENGRVGIQVAREFLPDVIVSDIIMPEQDGYGVLQELRQDPATATISFIFLTAKADKSEWRQGMNLGADDYLVKPFTQRELLDAIAVRLKRHTQVNERFEQRLEDLRSNITTSLPHEFLTPLSVILSASEVLTRHSDQLQPTEIPEIGERIQSSAQRLRRLINNFLLYTQLELATFDPVKAEALRGKRMSELAAVIADVASRLACQVGRSQDLSLEVEEVVVPLEPLRLGKIVEELLDNAFKYSPPNTPVQIKCHTENNQVLLLSVTNQGRGMTREQIARLGAYVQFERERYEQQGQGLGLALVKRLVELYGGELAIESLPQVKTSVQVTLPLPKRRPVDLCIE